MIRLKKNNGISSKFAEVAAWPISIVETIVREFQQPNTKTQPRRKNNQKKKIHGRNFAAPKNATPSLGTVFETSFDLKHPQVIASQDLDESHESEQDELPEEESNGSIFREEADLQVALDDYLRSPSLFNTVNEQVDQDEMQGNDLEYSDNIDYYEGNDDEDRFEVELLLEEMNEEDFTEN
jgi:hypothetical protein